MATNQAISIPGVTASSIDGELLWGFWYPALRSEELRGRALVTSTRLEVPLVLGRDAAGKSVCAARRLPAPRVSAFGGLVRRADGRVHVPRLAV